MEGAEGDDAGKWEGGNAVGGGEGCSYWLACLRNASVLAAMAAASNWCTCVGAHKLKK